MTSLFTWLYNILWWIVSSVIIFRIVRATHFLIRSIWAHFFSTLLDLKPYQDSWTVVTGCTNGIVAYIEELAKTRGIRKFYLIGRNPEKLNQINNEMSSRYNCDIKTAIFDFEKDDLDRVIDLPGFRDLEVGILKKIGNLVELPTGIGSKIVKVNLLSCIKMLELILPGMAKRDKGIIVNIASFMGWRPFPYMSTYPATKAAITFYTDTLVDEFKHTNLKIQCLIPALVATKIVSYNSKDADGLFVVKPTTFARQAVALCNLASFWLFKQFVPLVILGVHKQRVDEYQSRKEQ
uniref:Uncharacterized protein n=1 Tax=Acrobeloides nanus TaxID=290746 RepID=A0A914DT68_9BILA